MWYKTEPKIQKEIEAKRSKLLEKLQWSISGGCDTERIATEYEEEKKRKKVPDDE